MCCLFAAFVLLGPRFGILAWWLLDQSRWEAAIDNFFLAFIGWAMAPWTTLMYVLVFPGGVVGFDWIIIGIGVMSDLASWMSGGYSGRQYQTSTYGAEV